MSIRPAATVTVYPDGPLIVRGDVEIRTVDGTVVERSGLPIALCRCGRSAVKPYCDGSHKNTRLPSPARKTGNASQPSATQRG